MNLGFIVEGFNDEKKIKGLLPTSIVIVTKGTRLDNRIRNHINSALTLCSKVYLLVDPDKEGERLANMVLKEYPHLTQIHLDQEQCRCYRNHRWKIGVEHTTDEYLSGVLNQYL